MNSRRENTAERPAGLAVGWFVLMVTLGVTSLEVAACPMGGRGPSVSDLVCALVQSTVEASYQTALSDAQSPGLHLMAVPGLTASEGRQDRRPPLGLHESALPPPAAV